MWIRMTKCAAGLLGLALSFWIGTRSQSQDSPSQPAGVEVLARGPVHEAFIQPTTQQPVQGLVVPKQPPAPIAEIPPDQKPASDNVQWIPGYWAYDDESSDFIWVSGCWRVPPSGQRWMPGHWQEIKDGWLWISGFWTTIGTAEIRYLAPPPPTREQGPSQPPPDATSEYIPGCWVYANQYLWRPGQWIPFTADWVWVPASYVWTPGGCIFVDGYWDHPLDQRGLLFSPIRFDMRIWRPNPSFAPQFVVQSDFLMGSLFARQANHHFYFGDYFDPLYEKRGFVAWPDYHPSPRAYDPCFAYYRGLHSADPRWEPALRELYGLRRSGEVPRPPRTLTKQVEARKSMAGNKTENAAIHKNLNLSQMLNATVLAPLGKIQHNLVTNLASISGKVVPGHPVKVLQVSKEERERQLKSATQMRDIAQQRRDTEARMLSQAGNPINHTDPPKIEKLDLPQSSVGVQHVEKIAPPPVVSPSHEVHSIPSYTAPRPPDPPSRGKP
jgi:hypothetical protein